MKLRFDIYSLGLSFFAQPPLWVGNLKLLSLLGSILSKLKQNTPTAVSFTLEFKEEDDKYLNYVWDTVNCADFTNVHILLSLLIENERTRIQIWNNPTKNHDEVSIDRKVFI